MVRASGPLIIKDGQDTHPTKLGNLFFGDPLDKIEDCVVLCSEYFAGFIGNKRVKTYV